MTHCCRTTVIDDHQVKLTKELTSDVLNRLVEHKIQKLVKPLEDAGHFASSLELHSYVMAHVLGEIDDRFLAILRGLLRLLLCRVGRSVLWRK